MSMYDQLVELVGEPGTRLQLHLYKYLERMQLG